MPLTNNIKRSLYYRKQNGKQIATIQNHREYLIVENLGFNLYVMRLQ